MDQDISRSNTRLVSLDIIRVLAFLGVFSSHADLSSLGPWGASAFFLLSGFLLSFNACKSRHEIKCSFQSSIKYSRTKIKKLYFLHIAMIIAMLPFRVNWLIKYYSLSHLNLLLQQIVTNLLLIQSWIPSNTYYYSFNAVAWFLSTSAFLYFCFPLILRVIDHLKQRLSKNRWKAAVIVLAVILYSVQIVLGYYSKQVIIPLKYFDKFSKWFTYIFPLFRLGDFMIGCIAGCLFVHTEKGEKTRSSILMTILELFSIVMIIIANSVLVHIGCFGNDSFRFNMLFTPFNVLLIYVFALNEGYITKVLNCRLIRYLSTISAGAFLIHQVVMKYTDSLYKFIKYSPSVTVTAIIDLLLTILCTEIYLSFRKKKDESLLQKTTNE